MAQLVANLTSPKQQIPSSAMHQIILVHTEHLCRRSACATRVFAGEISIHTSVLNQIYCKRMINGRSGIGVIDDSPWKDSLSRLVMNNSYRSTSRLSFAGDGNQPRQNLGSY
jgi:hypothetical protein